MAYPALQLCPAPAALPRFIITTNILSGGNGSGMAGVNECDSLNIVLENVGRVTGTGIRTTLSTLTPNTAIAQGASAYPDLPITTSATNLTSFRLSISPVFKCGTSIDLMLIIKCDELTQTNYLSLRRVRPASRSATTTPPPLLSPTWATPILLLSSPT